MYVLLIRFFFFSSRRRHTRYIGDWSSDVCSSDLNEADEIRVLGKLLDKGYIYRGLKPVNWCFDCGSALAEAEVERSEERRVGKECRGQGSPSEDVTKANHIREGSAFVKDTVM